MPLVTTASGERAESDAFPNRARHQHGIRLLRKHQQRAFAVH